MKTPPYLFLFLCLTLTICLKPKPQAQAHLRGKITQAPTHDMAKAQEHNLKEQQNQHKQKLIDHDRSYTTNHHKHMAQNEQNHELFGHHSSSTSYHHQKQQNHQQERHQWDSSSSTTNHQHKAQGIRPKQHAKVQQNHKLYDETSSPTSSSDYRHKAQTKHNQWNQNGDDDTMDQQTDDQNYGLHGVNGHDKAEHELGSATSSYDNGRYHKMQEAYTHDDQMIRTRHHRVQVHDEFSQGDENDDTYDQQDDYHNYNTRNRQSAYQNHRQNDRDEPHDGNRYYYVDENNIMLHEVESSSETSSVKQPNLRDYVDYNNPLDPGHPLVQQQTNVVTTEVPDTIGAGKGANFDEDTSVSSSVISEYQKRKNQAREQQGQHQETYVPPPVQTTYVPPPVETTYVPPPVQPTPPPVTDYTTTTTTTTQPDTTTTYTQEDTSSSSRHAYHKTSSDNQHPDRLAQSHRQKTYKYQADAHQNQHKMEPFDEHQDDTEDDHNQLYHKVETIKENHLQHSTEPEHQQETVVRENHKTSTQGHGTETQGHEQDHLQYGTGSQHDNDDDHMTTTQNTQSTSTTHDDQDDNVHEKWYNPNTQQVL